MAEGRCTDWRGVARPVEEGSSIIGHGIRESVDSLCIGMTRTRLCRHTYEKLATARTLHL